MSHQNDPDYPEWVVNIMNQVRGCAHCGYSVGLVNIVGLGVHVPDRTDPRTLPQQAGQHPVFRIHARGRITVRCPRCHKDSAFEMSVDKMPLLSAVESLFDFIEGTDEPPDEVVLPSPNFPPPPPEEAPGRSPRKGMNLSRRPIRESRMFRGRMSFRGMMMMTMSLSSSRTGRAGGRTPPTDMPSQKEVDVFLRALGRTSFRRSTKSYQQFMRRLGVELDRDGSNDVGADDE